MKMCYCRVNLVRQPNARADWGGEAERLTFYAYYESDYRLRIKVNKLSLIRVVRKVCHLEICTLG